MTNETTMLRISKELKDSIKDLAKKEGRTLEWCTEDALNFYLFNFDKIQALNRAEAQKVKDHVVAEGRKLRILQEPTLVPDGQ